VNEHVAERLDRARRAIDAAARELEAGEPEFAADRVYYSFFYVAEALLSSRDLAFSSHGAVHGAFGKVFAKSGDIDADYHGWLLRTFEARQRATYGGGSVPRLAAEAVEESVQAAREFLSVARAFLERRA
jgi:uncharacterized protein (UPF0332 family)